MTSFRLGIVGLGLIGGSLALALKRSRPSWQLIGVDSNQATRAQALSAGAVDAAAPLDQAELGECDAVVLAVPAPALLELLPEAAARMRPGAVLTDVCGSKEAPCAAGAAQDRVIFVGGHPMAGTEFRGFSAASPELFEGATVALCPPVGAPDWGGALQLVGDVWRAAGAARLLEVDPAEHDRAVTYASHLPYLAAAAVVRALPSAGAAEQLARDLAAGGFRDTTRLAGDGTIGGAASLNRYLPAAARELAAALQALAAQLEEDPQAARELLSTTADERRTMKLSPRRPS